MRAAQQATATGYLRRSGIKQPILILGMTRPECAGALAAEGITQAAVY